MHAAVQRTACTPQLQGGVIPLHSRAAFCCSIVASSTGVCVADSGYVCFCCHSWFLKSVSMSVAAVQVG